MIFIIIAITSLRSLWSPGEYVHPGTVQYRTLPYQHHYWVGTSTLLELFGRPLASSSVLTSRQLTTTEGTPLPVLTIGVRITSVRQRTTSPKPTLPTRDLASTPSILIA